MEWIHLYYNKRMTSQTVALAVTPRGPTWGPKFDSGHPVICHNTLAPTITLGY